MTELNRRLFLQSTSLLIAGGATGLLGADGRLLAAPQFAAQPTFKPRALFLTWNDDPTTTMTVQWLGANEADGKTRSLWYRRSGSQNWHEQPHEAVAFPTQICGCSALA